MSASRSRFVAFWASYETRAKIWFRLFVATATLLALALIGLNRALARAREREVVRIGCDGLPVVTRVTEEYSAPNDVEIERFARYFVEHYARGDSESIVHDFDEVSRYMRAPLRRAFQEAARGTSERPGVVAQVRGLRQMTQIDPRSLKVQIDKASYPWTVHVEGERQIVGEDGPRHTQRFSVDLDLVRAPREEILEGLLVWDLRSKGDPMTGGIPKGE